MMRVSVDGRAYELSETLRSEELAPIFDTAWTASRVWTASRFLAEQLTLFAQRDDTTTTNDNDKDNDATHTFSVASGAPVIELGSGCGLAGLVAVALGASVVLSDQREAVELLQRNVMHNLPSLEERQRVVVHEYQWGTPAAEARLPHVLFKYILVSDCINPIYGTESWRQLARSIHLLSGAHTITYLAHEARGDDEAMADFQAFSAPFLSCTPILHDASRRLTLFKLRRRN